MSEVASSRSPGSIRGVSLQVISPGWFGNGGDRQTTLSKSRYGCFLPDLTGLARPPPIADLHALYRVAGGRAQAVAGLMVGSPWPEPYLSRHSRQGMLRLRVHRRRWS